MIWWGVPIGVGAAALVEWIKQIMPWSLSPRFKSAITALACGVAGLWLGHGTENGVLLAVLAFGLAPIIHALEALLRLGRDRAKVEVISAHRAGEVRAGMGLRPGRLP